VIDFLGETAFTSQQMFSVGSFSGRVEIAREFSPRPQITHVVFDFDGTLSWLRHGWPQIMAKLFREHLPLLPGETESALQQMLLAEILSLNGKPSVFQMRRCAELAEARGARRPSPETLLEAYQQSLNAAIAGRVRKIAGGQAAPDAYIVHGARALLGNLQRRGLTLVILSGTAEPQVREEAALLGLARYFGSHIYGGTADLVRSAKSAVIERLLREEHLAGDRLLSFGDGPVEIQLTKAAGGLAVAVASDEEVNGSGQPDPAKRKLLLEAGADLLVPDYRDADALAERLLG
jgi:phosphoglycolate phosphatase